jgi:hypothetical protein
MREINTKRIINYCIATVWIINGLFCKILNMVPRHQEIVGRILGANYAKPLTVIIGVFEVAMAIWILSDIKPKLNAIAQIIIIAGMNTIEFVLVPDLLLWGKLNAFFAFLFILIIFCNEFKLNKHSMKEV